MTKAVAKVYFRMTVLVVLGHVTGALIMLGNPWGAVTAALGCMYQMANVMLALAPEPIRITKQLVWAAVNLVLLLALAAGTGFLAIHGFILGTAVVAIAGLYQTWRVGRHVFEHNPTIE